MIVTAKASRKMPIPGVAYSSMEYGAEISLEIGNADKPQLVQERLHELYAQLDLAIGAKFKAAAAPVAAPGEGEPLVFEAE